MYKIIPITVYFFILYSLAFSQNDPHRLKGELKFKSNNFEYEREKTHDREFNRRFDQRRQEHKLRIGERVFPIYTHNGDKPTEPQLQTIKKVLTEDFLVNDDTIGGKVRNGSPSIAMDGRGNFIIVWEDDRNGNYDIYFQRYRSNGKAIGSNRKANDDIGTAWQEYPSIAMDGGGNFVIVWEDYRNGNSDIYFQRYSSTGTAIGSNTKANDDIGTARQWFASIAMDGNGNFAIVWQDGRNGNYDIYFQRYSSNGIAIGSNRKVNDDIGTKSQWRPIIAMNRTGKFVIVWEDERNDNWDIYFQLYSSNGIAIFNNNKANDDTEGAFQWDPSVAIDDAGNFVIAWDDERNSNYDIYFQYYTSSGADVGGNKKANDDIGTATQWTSSVAMDGTGNFVIVWEDYRNGNYDIYFQRYRSNGEAIGNNRKTNDDIGIAIQRYPSIAIDGSGNFVIVWEDNRNGNYDIYFQLYSSTGAAIGSNIKVNDDFGNAIQLHPSVAMDGSGNFIIVWQDDRNENEDIYFQRYSSIGTAIGNNRKVNDDTGTASQRSPSIAIDGSGNFVIVWEDNRNGNYDIYFQLYSSTGAAIGSNIKVNDDFGNAIQLHPSVAMDGAGNFVVVWEDQFRGGIKHDIYFQRYSSTGVAIGSNRKANDNQRGAFHRYPSIAMDGGGNFVIAWEDRRNRNYDIYFQRYTSNGLAINTNIKANDDVDTAGQYKPSVALDSVGNLLIVWEDERNGNRDIYFQRYNSTGTAIGSNVKVNNDVGTANQLYPSIAMDGAGNFVIVWEDYRYGLHNPDIIGQRYYPDGSPRGANYRIVANGPNHGEERPVATANSSKIVFSWMDNRRSKVWDIYGKIVGWNWDGVVTVSPENNIPTEFALYQNYPNPFNPSTNISFSIPTNYFVTLKIFDALGREVSTLISEELEAGSYTKQFNAEGLPSGVYFYRLEAVDPSTSSEKHFVQTRKLVLLR